MMADQAPPPSVIEVPKWVQFDKHKADQLRHHDFKLPRINTSDAHAAVSRPDGRVKFHVIVPNTAS